MLGTTVYTLAHDDPCDTTVLSPSGHVLYHFHTVSNNKNTVTRVTNSNGIKLAVLGWGVGVPDRVKYGDARPQPMPDWLKKSLLPVNQYFAFSDEQGRNYRWKSGADSWQLFAEDDKYTAPILKFENGSTETTARIFFTSRALEIQDLAIVSLLFLEKAKRGRRESKSTGTKNAASSVVAALFTALGNVGGGSF